jgi:hypothetical protein
MMMDHMHFDALARSFGTASRRNLGRAIAGGGFAALVGSAFGALDANAKKTRRKKRKRKKKSQTPITPPPFTLPPLVFNQFGCVEVGQPCRGDNTNCCSGICQGSAPAAGQPDPSRCVAHDTGTCKQDIEGICTTPDLVQVTCNNRTECGCFRTTSGSNYCAEVFCGPGCSQCVSCERDADCIAAGLPATSACAPVSAGRCAGACATGMACLVPCGPKPSGP